MVYCILKNPDTQRLAEFAAGLLGTMGSFGDNEFAFRSAAGDVFGYFLEADKAAAQIRSAIEKSGYARTGDVIMVQEISDFAAVGNSRAWTWLQRRIRKAP